jgi:hypothetical protein
MKTAGVGSILSIICVGIASACGSQVSIGHNDRAVSSDSGTPGSGGQGQAWVDMGTSTTGTAGQYGVGGTAGQVGTAGAAQYGAGGAGWIVGRTFEADPGGFFGQDGGSGPCVPLDSTGAVASGTGWTLPPGTKTNACIEHVLEAPAEIYAVHSVNSPGVVRSWVGLSPTMPPNGSGQNCVTAGPATFLHTVNAYEQLTIFKAPIHADTGAFIVGGFNVANTTEQPLTGDGQIWLLPSAPPSMVPCAVHGAFAGMDGGWELDPGLEELECVRLTLNYERQPFVVRIENTSEGMESVLSYGDATGSDGPGACSQASDAGTQLAIAVGATTVETKPRDVRMMPGQQLVLRVRFFNTTTHRLTGSVSAKLY